MANVVSGIDVAWSAKNLTSTDLNGLWDRGCRVISLYLSYSPSKDATPELIKRFHGFRRTTSATYGFGVMLNFESTADRALSGHDAGVYDGQHSRQEIYSLYSGVGYRPASKLAVGFSVDFDTNPSQYPVIDSYLRGAQEGLTKEFLAGDYGEYDLIKHTAAAGTSFMEWQTYAWSNGQFAAGVADFYQWSNSHTIGGHADVDYDQIIDQAKLGAWWGPGHPLNKPGGVVGPVTPTPTGDWLDMATEAQLDAKFNTLLHRILGETTDPASPQHLVSTYIAQVRDEVRASEARTQARIAALETKLTAAINAAQHPPA